MCNCNQKRMQFSSNGNKSNPQQGMGQVRLTSHRSLTLQGDVTERSYHFKTKGEIQWVDRTDLHYMRGVPGIEILG